MAAFQRAVDLGYRYLETDVHATADGVLLAFHDDTLDRVTDRTGRVARLPWATVGRARIGGREPIPLLEDLLGSWPDVRVNVDVKERSAVGAAGPDPGADRRGGPGLRGVLLRQQAGCGPGRGGPGAVHVAGHPRRRPAPGRGAAPGRAPAGPARGPLRPGPGPGRLAPGRHARPGRAAHALGQQVHVWTVDEAAEMHRLLDLGVDGLMTDRLVTLRDVLRSARALGILTALRASGGVRSVLLVQPSRGGTWPGSPRERSARRGSTGCRAPTGNPPGVPGTLDTAYDGRHQAVIDGGSSAATRRPRRRPTWPSEHCAARVSVPRATRPISASRWRRARA